MRNIGVHDFRYWSGNTVGFSLERVRSEPCGPIPPTATEDALSVLPKDEVGLDGRFEQQTEVLLDEDDLVCGLALLHGFLQLFDAVRICSPEMAHVLVGPLIDMLLPDIHFFHHSAGLQEVVATMRS